MEQQTIHLASLYRWDDRRQLYRRSDSGKTDPGNRHFAALLLVRQNGLGGRDKDLELILEELGGTGSGIKKKTIPEKRFL